MLHLLIHLVGIVTDRILRWIREAYSSFTHHDTAKEVKNIPGSIQDSRCQLAALAEKKTRQTKNTRGAEQVPVWSPER